MEARTAVHPFADLNAYIDGALDPQSRERVDAHLGSCAICSTRVAELRATAKLIAALPAPAPARSLVPRIAVPMWLAPLRTASAVASGLALVVFVISLGSGFARQTSGAAAPAPQLNDRTGAAASGQPALAPAPPSSAAFSAVGSPNPAARSAADTQKAVTGTAAPGEAAQQTATAGPQAVALHAPANPESGQSPVVWLALAIAFAVIAIFATWRLRAA
ncbi:MAG: hypothetical protein E6H84_05880 [Chloroflexi bacterium]|nr:MAG: hypothetical protein E6I83_05700 [Chloroflexota bacterium]TMG55718.1 MAG: hypothetical protein E6H84_05880 [Chloroflexota bacterium]TMG66050.1 MAG: hypothetical protein E6H81_14515 [Chloroflexota bacterium]